MVQQPQITMIEKYICIIIYINHSSHLYRISSKIMSKHKDRLILSTNETLNRLLLFVNSRFYYFKSGEDVYYVLLQYIDSILLMMFDDIFE